MGAWDYVSTLTLDSSGYNEQINKAITSTKQFKEQTDKTDKALNDLSRDGGKTQQVFQQLAQKTGLSKEKTLQFGTALNSATKVLGLVGVAVTAACAAYAAYEKTMNSVGDTQRKLEAKQKSYTAVIDAFWVALNQGDISGYLSKMSQIRSAAYEATKQLKLLSLADPTLKLQEKTFEYRKAELERQLRSTTDPGQQQVILGQLKSLVDEYKAFWGTVQNENEKGLNTLLKSYRTKFGNFGIGDVTVKQLNGQWRAGYDNRSKIQSTTYSHSANESEVLRYMKEYVNDYGKLTEILNTSDWDSRFRAVQNTGTLVRSGSANGYGGWREGFTRVNYNQDAINQYVAMRTIASLTEEELRQLQTLVDGVTEVGIKYENESRSMEDLQREIQEENNSRQKEAAENQNRQNEAYLKELQSQRQELKSLLSKLGSPGSVSGISNYDRRLAEVLDKLSQSEIGMAQGHWLAFENAVSSLEKQYHDGIISQETYNREIKELQKSLSRNVGYISNDLAALLDEVIESNKKPGDSSNNIAAWSGTNIWKAWGDENQLIKDWAKSIKNRNRIDYTTYSEPALEMEIQQLQTMRKVGMYSVNNLMLEPGKKVGDMNVFDLYSTLGMDHELNGENWTKLYDFYMQYESMYERLGEISKNVPDEEKRGVFDAIQSAMASNMSKMREDFDLYQKHADMVMALQGKYEEAAQRIKEYGDMLQSIGGIFGNLGTMFDESTNKWLTFTGTFIDGIAQMLPHIAEMIKMQKSAALANGLAGAAKVPFPGNIPAILSIVGIITSVISSIPAFAGGGVFDGKTSLGDFNLARVNDGEMILNNSQQGKLFRMLNSGNPDHVSNQNGEVTFKIQGTQLVGVLNNYEKIHSRTR